MIDDILKIIGVCIIGFIIVFAILKMFIVEVAESFEDGEF